MASSRKNFSIWTLAEIVWNQTEASEMGQKSIGWKSHGNHKIGGNGQNVQDQIEATCIEIKRIKSAITVQIGRKRRKWAILPLLLIRAHKVLLPGRAS